MDPRKKTLVRPSLIPTISNGMIGSGRFDTKSSIFAKRERENGDSLYVVSGQSLAEKQETNAAETKE